MHEVDDRWLMTPDAPSIDELLEELVNRPAWHARCGVASSLMADDPKKRTIRIDWRSPKAEEAVKRVLRLPSAMDLGIPDALNMALENVAREVLGNEVEVTEEIWEQRTEAFAYMLAVMSDIVWSLCNAADGLLQNPDGTPVAHGTNLNAWMKKWPTRFGPTATDPPSTA